MNPYDKSWEVGDIALVTMRSGIKFKGKYMHAPGIDYFWMPLPGQPHPQFLIDVEANAERLDDE